MKLKHIFYSFCFATVMFACTNEPLIEPNETLLEANSKGIANAPEESGMYLTRGEQQAWIYTISDVKTELTMVIGLNVTTACNGGNPIFDYLSFQEVSNPNNMVVNLVQGDIHVEVFEYFPFPSCNFIYSNKRLAEGTANIIYTDNDLYAYENPGNNYNAFSLMITGQIEGEDGSMKNLQGGFHARWNPNDPDSYTQSVFVRLQ